jgi:hypothetical protein
VRRAWIDHNLLPYYAAWIPMTALVGWWLSGGGRGAGFGVTAGLLFGLPLAAVGAGLRFMCRALPLRRHRILNTLTAVVGASAAFAGLWTALFALVMGLARPLPADRVAGLATSLFLVGTVALIFSLLYHYLVEAAEQVGRARRAEDEARVQAGEARLRALSAQVNPHFLYNGLNSVAALIGAEPAAAREMVTRLAMFFRGTTAAGRLESIPLSEELELVRGYLAIEQVRFGARLVVMERVDEALLSTRWPPLFLQPLVENAVKYGVSGSMEPVTLELEGALEDDYALLRLRNGFDRDGLPAPGTGTGLSATGERLERFFGPRAVLTVEAAVGTPGAVTAGAVTAGAVTPGAVTAGVGTFTVTLRVPREALR